ncbi:MAG TPA: hypothetical protein VFB41_02130 [Solirubrobacteraceae bacterium]|nr:hypothetical protein [Solirubrobacteraceae bacterium]
MRDRELLAALRTFAEEACWTLSAETAEGAEVSFDIIGEPSGRDRPTLYCYRADTEGFIADRVRDLVRLETWQPTVQLLSGKAGLDAYLRARGHTRVPVSDRERAEAVLRAFLERLFENATEFVLSDERLTRATSELDALLTASRADVEVVVPLLGVTLASDELALADGLALIRPEALDNVPEEAAWDGEHPNALVYVTGSDDGVAGDAANRARRVVTALRLYDSARVAMGPAAWIRTAGGPWQVVATGAGGRPDGTLVVAPDSEDELRAFCNLVWRRIPHRGELAWALRRYELGCERPAAQRLTDHLIALRALLEPEGPASGLLGDRVGALCAPEHERAAVAERVTHAAALERAIIAGHGGGVGAVALANELAEHLRAILRDVLCGHLDADLRSVADELLTTAA